MSIAEAFAKHLPEFLSPSDLADIEDVLNAAVEWKLDRLPLGAFAEVGTIPSWTGRPNHAYSRYVAVCLTPREDPRRAVLLEAIDELLRPFFRFTSHGCFAGDELAGVTIRYRPAA